VPTVWRTRHNPAKSDNCHLRGCVVKRCVDIEQLLGMLHKQSSHSHSLVPAWFYWLDAGAVSWLCSGVDARRRDAGQGPRRERDGTVRCHRGHDRRGASGYPVTSTSLPLRSRLMLNDSVPHSGPWTVAVIGFGIHVVFGHRIRGGAKVCLVETSVPEQQYRAVSGEGKKVCCGRCGTVFGCPGRRYIPCLPVIRQPFRFDATFTPGGQQVDAMEVWS
jgi:hypothetical protein